MENICYLLNFVKKGGEGGQEDEEGLGLIIGVLEVLFFSFFLFF